MFERLSLSKQLNIAFSSIILLLVVISFIAYLGLSGGFTSFTEYRGLARDTNLAGRVQANLLMVRLNVLKYIKSDSQEVLESYQQRLGKTKEFLNTALKEIQKPERAKNVKASVALIEEYETAFEEVVQLIAEHHKVVKGELDPAGLAMRKNLTEFLEYANRNKWYEEVYLLSKSQEALLLGRLYVTKYLGPGRL
ncbi:MCP four helix bundle domain-containing protein [Catenovulum sp. SM1970]|uniref:MCP four helix bundle domain-containing protein n=1 Tax=Marinifaba aquimaris TaxID=2741323 RepID=UPI0015719B0F|nr:MCP four helix bundle domain-containing protein [Marinifaba aquimaris]NTS78035.1 MCP four helix bundle domain-containing protein [Marinifaba aquimaris]